MRKALLLMFATLLATAVAAQSSLTKKEIKVLKKTHEISMLAEMHKTLLKQTCETVKKKK